MSQMNELKHYGVKGMRWGVRKEQKKAEKKKKKLDKRRNFIKGIQEQSDRMIRTLETMKVDKSIDPDALRFYNAKLSLEKAMQKLEYDNTMYLLDLEERDPDKAKKFINSNWKLAQREFEAIKRSRKNT